MDYDDFALLLLNGEPLRPSGAFDHATWKVVVPDDGLGVEARYASLHESLHDDLSSSTSFGSLLFLMSAHGRKTQNTSVFRSLIEKCRLTHECFATFIASLLVAPNDWIEIARHYPVYRDYFSLARSLTDGFEGSFMRYHAVTSACRICMQGSVLQPLLKSGPAAFFPGMLRSLDYPDTRLRLLLRYLNKGFWQRVFTELSLKCEGLPGWDRVLESERLPGKDSSDLYQDCDHASMAIMHSFYETLASVLQRNGAVSLSFNGHQEQTTQLIHQYGLHGRSGEQLPFRAAPPGEHDAILVSNFANERFYTRSSRMQATVVRFRDIPVADYATLASGPEDLLHIFLVARLTTDLLEQYDCVEDDHRSLVESSDSVLCCIRRAALVNGERVVELVIFDEPSQLRALGAQIDTIPIFANLSFAALANVNWRDEWFSSLTACTEFDILFDLAPFEHFQVWSGRKEPVRWTVMDVESRGRRFNVFACVRGEPPSPCFIMPCSEVVCGALAHYLLELLPSDSAVTHDPGIAEQYAALLKITIGHLLGEECLFHFHSGSIPVNPISRHSQPGVPLHALARDLR
jgi:hypothetical protein